MKTEENLLDHIREQYFTETDELKENVKITYSEVADLQIKLINIVAENGNNALNEAIESFIDKLQKVAV
ncbi:hypothetical protein [Kaistella sp.]|uniref:hypothetical protein n=1 Tax=Kaistella sp. TaxID=2782235 RepID=UPI002F9390CC